jgi:hypothetical protein
MKPSVTSLVAVVVLLSAGPLFAQQVRADPQDNLWIVDQMANMVLKFDQNLRLVMTLGRRNAGSPSMPRA